MTDGTTTIEIRDDQLEQLKAMKRVDRESYKSVLDRLLDGDTEAMSVDATDVQDALGLPDEAIPDDLQNRLDRIESGVREATNAAQSADKKLEGLGR